jgi:GNAT superfamily N-acetyltransferase
MRFEMTEALLDNILFAMEDQHGEFLVDTQEGLVVGEESFDFGEPDRDGDRFIPLPEWDSAHGYRLMERFAAGCRNGIIREKLTLALDRGRGVFRAFKNVLSGHPEAEQLWFAFKDREMKREVIRWYNALREDWGLERIGTEPEETGDLVLEDFCFREPRPDDSPRAAGLHARCMGENGAGTEGRSPPEGGAFPGTLVLVAETGGGDFAAYLSVARENKTLRIAALEVAPEYRGLGVGEALFSRVLDATDDPSVSHIIMDLPVTAEGFSRVLVRQSFKPVMTRYMLVREKSPFLS